MTNAAICALPGAGLRSGSVYEAVPSCMNSSVVSTSIIDVLDDIDFAIRGPVIQSSCPECYPMEPLASGARIRKRCTTWPCTASHRDVCQVDDEEAFSKGKFAFKSDAGSPNAAGGIDIGIVDANID